MKKPIFYSLLVVIIAGVSIALGSGDANVDVAVTYEWQCKKITDYLSPTCFPKPVSVESSKGDDLKRFVRSNDLYEICDSNCRRSNTLSQMNKAEKQDFSSAFIGTGLKTIQGVSELQGKRFVQHIQIPQSAINRFKTQDGEGLTIDTYKIDVAGIIEKRVEDQKIKRIWGEKYPGFDPKSPDNDSKISKMFVDALKKDDCSEIFNSFRESDSKALVNYFGALGKDKIAQLLQDGFKSESGFHLDVKTENVQGPSYRDPGKDGKNFQINLTLSSAKQVSQKTIEVEDNGMGGFAAGCGSKVVQGAVREMGAPKDGYYYLGSFYKPQVLSIKDCSMKLCVSWIPGGKAIDANRPAPWGISDLIPGTISFRPNFCWAHSDGTCPDDEHCVADESLRKEFAGLQVAQGDSRLMPSTVSQGQLVYSYTSKQSLEKTPSGNLNTKLESDIPPALMSFHLGETRPKACQQKICLARAYVGPAAMMSSPSDFDFQNSAFLGCKLKQDGTCPSASQCRDENGTVSVKDAVIKQETQSGTPGINGAGTVE